MNVFNHNRRRAQQAQRYDVAGALLAFLDKMKPMAANAQARECDAKTFALLLSGVGALRKVPGVEGPLSFHRLYLCPDQPSRDQLRSHCNRLYGVHDLESLDKFMEQEYNTQVEYEQFRTFWKGSPCFDVNELKPEGRFLFEACRDFAQLLAPIAGRQGFFAFDCAERLTLLRLGYAAGWMQEEQFWQRADKLSAEAARRCHSWLEYAASYLCGACYDLFRGAMKDSGQVDKAQMQEYVELNCRLLERLLTSQEGWQGYAWYQKPGKQYRIPPSQMRPLLVGYEGGEQVACLASDRITVDGMPVGYLYREQPLNLPGVADSGWRMFAGDESPEYMQQPEHFEFYHLNTLCNYDCSILPLLNAASGSAFQRQPDGRWQARRTGGQSNA